MAAKRSRKRGTSNTSMVSNAAQTVGKALGNAVSAIESAVGARRRGPNGYQKMQSRGEQPTLAADRPSRSRSRKASPALKPKPEGAGAKPLHAESSA
jgi:hypothetical protein